MTGTTILECSRVWSAAVAVQLQMPQHYAERDFRDPAVRLNSLLDRDSLLPLHEQDTSGVTAVRGRIAGQPVISYCTDGANMGGAMGSAGCARIVAAIETARREAIPVIGLWHSGGARIADGVESMDGVGRVFAAMVAASGQVPQISVVLGPAAGAAAYGPALTDIVIMSPAARMFITGPDIVRAVTGEQVDMETLGGSVAHGRKSGVAHMVVDSEADAFLRARRVIELLTRPGACDLAAVGEGADLRSLLPDRPRRAYDIKPLIGALLDETDPLTELQPGWARNVVVGLGRLAGRTVGVVASNPLHKGGCLDSLSAEKAARFVRMCDAFGVPLLVVVDVPGYLPGVGQEWGGVIRRGAKLLYAFAEASVPRVTVITRKSYGGAYIAMNSRSLGATTVYAWPDAQVAVMSAESAVEIVYKKRLAAVPSAEREPLLRDLVKEHAQAVAGVDRALSLGVVDAVIDPVHTRRKIAEALAAAPSPSARGRHGNIPL